MSSIQQKFSNYIYHYRAVTLFTIIYFRTTLLRDNVAMKNGATMIRDAMFKRDDLVSKCVDCSRNLSECDMHFVSKSSVLVIGGAQMLHIYENAVAFVVSLFILYHIINLIIVFDGLLEFFDILWLWKYLYIQTQRYQFILRNSPMSFLPTRFCFTVIAASLRFSSPCEDAVRKLSAVSFHSAPGSTINLLV